MVLSLINDERPIAKVLDDAINANSKVTQKEIAEYAGLPKPNIIYMFKTGLTKVPLDKAGKIAYKLGLNEREFWFKCFKEYMPGAYSEYERVLGHPVLTADEIELIKKLRATKTNPKTISKSLTQTNP